MDEKTKLLSVYFPEDLVVWLKAEAKIHKWTVSRTLRWAVREMKQQREASVSPSRGENLRALL